MNEDETLTLCDLRKQLCDLHKQLESITAKQHIHILVEHRATIALLTVSPFTRMSTEMYSFKVHTGRTTTFSADGHPSPLEAITEGRKEAIRVLEEEFNALFTFTQREEGVKEKSRDGFAPRDVRFRMVDARVHHFKYYDELRIYITDPLANQYLSLKRPAGDGVRWCENALGVHPKTIVEGVGRDR